MPSHSPGTFALISLGCPKNLVDTERMAGLLQGEGYRLVSDPKGADFVLINTCGFIGDARAESNQAIREMIQLKKKRKLRGIIVAGCLAERDKEQLLKQFPQIDQLVGVFGREEITEAAHRIQSGNTEERTIFRSAPSCPPEDTLRLRLTEKHLAFLKIAEGCNRLCSFCSIPLMRGRYASKPIEQIVAEAESLAADGVKELVLIAQDTTFYGIDRYGKPRLAELLQRLDQVEGIAWIRLMYLYPMHLGDELLETLAGGKKILPYLDIPLQHINDEVLQRMRRRVNRAETETLLTRLRQTIPSLVLRTTFITGFPGETDAQFAELLEFVQEQKFERLGVFPYCEEENTPAVELDGKLPDQVKIQRRDELLAAQQPIAFQWNQAQIGRRLDVILDRYIPEQSHALIGRSYADAPEIDGAVYVTGENLVPGQIRSCEIVTSQGYDLIAVPYEDEEKLIR